MPYKYENRADVRAKIIGIRLTQANYEAIAAMAEEEDRTPSQMCRKLLSEALNARSGRGITIRK